MDISSIQSTAAQAAKFARTKDSNGVTPGATTGTSDTAAAARTDQASFHGAAQETTEMTAARAAMKSIDTLDDARRAEIQARLQSGFYTQPDIIESVSESMAEALTPNQGPKTG